MESDKDGGVCEPYLDRTTFLLNEFFLIAVIFLILEKLRCNNDSKN